MNTKKPTFPKGPTFDIKEHLEENGFICAFNVNDQMDVQGAVKASRDTQAPVILLISKNAVKFSGVSELIYLCRSYASKFDARAFTALDHWQDTDSALQACRSGIDMIMFDYSQEPYEKNLEYTLCAVEKVKKWGVLVEGEVGRIGDTSGLATSHPSRAQIAEFTERTGVDILAAPVGTLHGLGEKPEVDSGTPYQACTASPVPVCAHGCDFIKESDLQNLREAGVAKFNFGPELRKAYVESIAASLPEAVSAADHRHLLSRASMAVQTAASDRIRSLKAFRKPVS